MIRFGHILLTTVTSVVGTLGAPLAPEIARTADVSLRPAQWSLTRALLAGVIRSDP